jgi:hypothetical protein
MTDLSAIIDALVEAYNGRDAKTFSEFFAIDAQCFEHPNRLAQRSRQEICDTYTEVFRRVPQNRTTVLHRIVIGNRVIDHERVQRAPDVAPFDAVAIYELHDGLIQRFDLVRDVPPLVSRSAVGKVDP